MVGKISYVLILTLWGMLLMGILCVQSPAIATTVDQQIAVNGTVSLNTTYANGDDILWHTVYVDGIAYVNITYDDGSSNLIEMQNYILSQQSGWSSDHRGVSMREVINSVGEAADYRTGKTDYLSDPNQELLGALNVIAAANVGDFYNNDFKNLQGKVDENRGLIKNNAYEIEALYVTLEKLAPDIYCESKIEVIKRYNLPAVKCGLHSKICYNGKVSDIEGGREYCLRTDNDEDYLPCINTLGRCGRLDSISILDSEANSFTPLKAVFTNTGKMTLSPSIKVEVYEIDGYAPIKVFEQNLGEVLEGETKATLLYFDNSGLEAGKKYELRTTLSSGRKEILDRQDYKMLPEGTFNRSGTLAVSNSEPIFGEAVQINGIYLNTGKEAYSTKMKLEIFLNNKRFAENESESLAFRPGEAKIFTINYLPVKEGNYTIFAEIIGTDITKRFDFEVKNPEEKIKTTELFSIMDFLWE